MRIAEGQRLACVHLPAFALQWALRHPGRPADVPWAVVDREEASGVVRWVNRRAWAGGVRAGMRLGAAQGLCRALHAVAVREVDLVPVQEGLGELLRQLSPRVEPVAGQPGMWWLDASGLERLFGGVEAWGSRLLLMLQEGGWRGHAVVGWSRMGTRCLAWTGPGLLVLEDPGAEARALGRVPLERLELTMRSRTQARELGLETVGDLVRLGRAQVVARLEPDLVMLWEGVSAWGDGVPVQDAAPLAPVQTEVALDLPQPTVGALLHAVGEALVDLHAALASRGEVPVGLAFTLQVAGGGGVDASVRLASPSSDPRLLEELVRLRLEKVRMPERGLRGLHLRLEGVRAEVGQAGLWGGGGEGPRDLAAAGRALARLAAEHGPDAVGVWARQAGHLPEAQARFVPTTTVSAPHPARTGGHALVRRLLCRPRPLPGAQGRSPDGWLVAGVEAGPVVHHSGPWVVSGGWWHREVHREYHYVETRRGDFLWVFHDPSQRRWFRHGELE